MAQNNIINSPLPTAIAKGGTGQTTATAAFDALSPAVTLGDLIYRDATNNVRLGGNTTTTRKFLLQVGNGSASAAPSWDTVTKTDVGLSAVENTALSTWAGSSNITTLGTISTGTVPYANTSGVQQALSGLSLTAVSVVSNDKVLIQDTSDSNNLKTALVSDIAALASSGAASLGKAYAISISAFSN